MTIIYNGQIIISETGRWAIYRYILERIGAIDSNVNSIISVAYFDYSLYNILK